MANTPKNNKEKEFGNLLFKIIAPKDMAGSIQVEQTGTLKPLPKTLKNYLKKPNISAREEHLASLGKNLNTLPQKRGLMLFRVEEIPQLSLFNERTRKYNVFNISYNPNLGHSEKEFVESINWLLEYLNQEPRLKKIKVYQIDGKFKLIDKNIEV